MQTENKIADALQAARMYYYQNMTSNAIAKEMNVSRSTVSRLLSFAKSQGLIEIRIVDPTEEPDQLASIIVDKFEIQNVHVVPVPEITGEAEWLQRVAQHTANYLNTIFDSNMIFGIAWGTTLTAISSIYFQKPPIIPKLCS